MSTVHFQSERPRHFLTDSRGDMYEVSEEIAVNYASMFPKNSVQVDHVDPETNTVWFSSPGEVKVH